MEKRMSEQELLDTLDDAISEGHIFAYYQPQINHSTGRMVGAASIFTYEMEKVESTENHG